MTDDLAVHDLAVHDLGGVGPTLPVSHATGFHGRCYLPMAEALATRFHSIAFDYRGHGDSPPHDGLVDWERYGDDAHAVASSLTTSPGTSPGTSIRAFGHSMGGACLLMAAHRNPSLFSRIVVFEPIVFPPAGLHPDGTGSPLAAGARRRRSSFPSIEDAIERYASRPPLGMFTAEALDAYVRYGFAEGEDGQVHLKCRPETEAATYEMGGVHRTWEILPEIETPVLVLAGHVDPMQPSEIAAGIAERLPNATYVEMTEWSHFAPMTHPGELAELVSDFV